MSAGGQQTWCDARADGHSPDERERAKPRWRGVAAACRPWPSACARALVVDGGIYRHEFVAGAVIDGLMRVQLDTGVPVLNGVLAVERIEDAEARAGGSHGNKGEEAALAAIEMAHLLAQLA